MSRTTRRQNPSALEVTSLSKNHRDKSCSCPKCGKRGRHGQGFKDVSLKLFFKQQLKEFIG